MRFLVPILENPWCLLISLIVALVVVGGAGFIALVDRQAKHMPTHPPQPSARSPGTGSAPIEGLTVLYERLMTLQRHLPPDSDDARWLRRFAQRLRRVMDDLSARLELVDATEHERLLDRLREEVEALAGTINLQLGATLNHDTDRQALEAKLARLRDTLEG